MRQARSSAGFWAGVAAGAAATAVLFAYRGATGTPTLPEVLAERMIRLLPYQVFALLLAHLQHLAKPLALAGAVALLLVGFGLGGAAAVRLVPSSRWPGAFRAVLVALATWVILTWIVLPAVEGTLLGVPLTTTVPHPALPFALASAVYGGLLAALSGRGRRAVAPASLSGPGGRGGRSRIAGARAAGRVAEVRPRGPRGGRRGAGPRMESPEPCRDDPVPRGRRRPHRLQAPQGNAAGGDPDRAVLPGVQELLRPRGGRQPVDASRDRTRGASPQTLPGGAQGLRPARGTLPDAGVHQQRGGGRPHQHRPVEGGPHAGRAGCGPGGPQGHDGDHAQRGRVLGVHPPRGGDGPHHAPGVRDERRAVAPEARGARPRPHSQPVRDEAAQVAHHHRAGRPPLHGLLGAAGVVPGGHREDQQRLPGGGAGGRGAPPRGVGLRRQPGDREGGDQRRRRQVVVPRRPQGTAGRELLAVLVRRVETPCSRDLHAG